MGEVINWPGPGRSSREGRSVGSKRRAKGRHPSVAPFRSRAQKTLEGCGPAGTISQPVDKAAQGLWPFPPESPKWLKSGICPEALAFPDSIMDDKSMQAWTSLQLTLPEPARTIRVVGRPNEPTSPAAYRASFFKRVRTARELYTDSPQEMAHALGVPAGTYTRYETRTMLPHHLVPRFCKITGVTADWLFYGPSAARALNPSRSATGTDPS